ncbi:MAG: DUF2306 domain-containing protein [Alphaproteobacteria bacterium]|nr:DUF2306 domain-containing protein [Alphaproteobacteria bacterium]MBL6936360.1 DUF2306 domain-containing protein [Alphaproteobacteria bacterium]MBL7098589.1 DUF2306 domain-containing protein [Alphaproteobacteria bacterium]
MERSISRFAFGTMAFLSVAIALHAMRFDAVPMNLWLGVDEGIRHVVERVPFQALTHMLVAPFALLFGPFQFMPRLRARYPRIHRVSGRIYVAACIVAGLGALFTAPYASGGRVPGIGFAILAVLWIGTTTWAWRAAVARNFALHRTLMRYSYAMTFGAVTLRLQIPFFFMAGFHSYSEASVWLAYTSWIPNVLIVALYDAWNRPRKPALVAAE